MLKRQVLSRFKLVTFDITGTLLRFKRPAGEEYAKAGIKFDVSLEPKLLTESFNRQWKQMNLDYPNFGFATELNWESWWCKIVHQTFKEAAPDSCLDNEKLDKISGYLTQIYRKEDCWELCDGALEILDRLAENQIPVGVISNFDPRLDEVLTNMGIRKYFKFIISSYSVGVEKPDSRIFQLAVELNKDRTVKPSDIIHIGNSFSLDLQAALNVGWNACLVLSDEELPFDPSIRGSHQNSSLIFKDLHHLRKYLLSDNIHRFNETT